MPRFLIFVFALFAFGAMAGLIVYGPGTATTPGPRPPQPSEPAVVLGDGTRIEWIEAKARCDVEARDFLIAPSTARFPLVGRPVLENNAWRHVVVVDAQNVFGAMIRSRFICVIDGDAGTIRVQVAE